jgi:hypothetical protein
LLLFYQRKSNDARKKLKEFVIIQPPTGILKIGGMEELLAWKGPMASQ